MRAVAYIRTEGDSPADQERAIESWAARQAIEVLAWRLDLGVAGATPIAERPGLLGAYRALREHRAGLLVAANAACFSQDELVAWLIERAALDEGAELATADGSERSAAGGGRTERALSPPSYSRGAVDLARAYDRVTTRGRIRARQAEKRARGERIGNLPYGFRLAADGLHTEPDPREQEVLATIRRLAGEGHSQRAIARHLAASGVTGRTGAPLGQTQVSNLLRR